MASGCKAIPNPGVTCFTDEIGSKYFKLFKHALKLTHNMADAEDLTQDVILRGIERQHLFESGTNLEAWLYVIMNRLFFLQRRRAYKINTYFPDDVIYRTMGKGEMPADIQLSDREELKRAFDTMDRCLKPQLKAIVLAAVDSTYEEAAVKANVPMGTVKSRLHRGRGRLREALNGIA